MTTCRHDAEHGYVTADGQPCTVDEYGDPTRHCTARRTCSQHVGPTELTCARCLGRTRGKIRRIPILAALMPTVALEAGSINAEAVTLAGPAADPEAWSWMKVAARQGLTWHLSLVEDDDDRHPYTVLSRWAAMITEDYGHTPPEKWTTANAADYLDRQLSRIAQDPEQDFPLLAREIRACQRHLDVVASLARNVERGAPCPDCTIEGRKAPRLVRVYPHHCEDPTCERIHYYDDSGDIWRCPDNPEHTRSHEDYERWLDERKRA